MEPRSSPVAQAALPLQPVGEVLVVMLRGQSLSRVVRQGGQEKQRCYVFMVATFGFTVHANRKSRT